MSKVLISLGAVDEVITARTELHGGTVGAPVRLEDGIHQGAALNKACVVLLSSALQAYVEEVFVASSQGVFGKFGDEELKRYRKTWSRWGNPNPDNITALFRRLGVDDIFEGLSWQGQSSETLKKNLRQLNEIRNCIAHGSPLRSDNKPFSLTLAKIKRWRTISASFGAKFEDHALSKVGKKKKKRKKKN